MSISSPESTELARALERGCEYLVRQQGGDGAWHDFQLPVGTSDAWVTAYVGSALAAAPDSMATPSRPSVRQATDWLRTHRPYPAGWGFNSVTGPDADSTAWALTLLESASVPVRDLDRRWLLDRQGADGGFGTYERADGWGESHPDVTATAIRALGGRGDVAKRGISYLARSRRADGTWPAYWWTTDAYATYECATLLVDLGLEPMDVVPLDAIRHEASAFGLACWAGTASIASDGLTMFESLAALQLEDGSWPSQAVLRVTDPIGRGTGGVRTGRTYADSGVFTTATVARILARSLRRWDD